MLGNAAVAAVLAAFAAALDRCVRAPAVRHAAWVLVLLKLVTPPLVRLPLPVLPADHGPTADGPGLALTDKLLLAWIAGAAGWFAWQGRLVVRFRRRVRAAADAPVEVQLAATRIAKALGID